MAVSDWAISVVIAVATCATVVGVSVINGVAVAITVDVAESTVVTACVTTACAATTSGV